jgi:hypothetical protein
MLANLTAPYFAPFTVALVVLVGLVILEGLSTLIGKSASSVMEHLLGGHAGDADLDADADADHAGHGFGGVLDWLNAGRVPLMVLIVFMLTWFAAIGFVLQGILHGVLVPLPAWVAAIVAVALAVPPTRWTSRALAHIVPKDETYVVQGSHFVGRTGTITVGPARRGVVARMRIQDVHGNWHFPKVEPFAPDAVIAEGALVLVIEEDGGTLRVAPAEGSLARAD